MDDTIPDAATAQRVRVRWWPVVVSLAVLVVTLVLGILLYPSAPDPMPVHFDGELQPDAWGPKNLGGFLLPVIIGGVIVVVFWLVGMQLSPRPAQSPATLAAVTRLLEHLMMAMAVFLSITAITSWVGVPLWMSPWLLPLLLVALAGSLLPDGIRVFRVQRGLV